jgi:hypothetical protein
MSGDDYAFPQISQAPPSRFTAATKDAKAKAFLYYLDEECERIKRNVDTKTVDWIFQNSGEKVILEAILEDQIH